MTDTRTDSLAKLTPGDESVTNLEGLASLVGCSKSGCLLYCSSLAAVR